MAHFYGEMKGNRGETSRAGTKESGIAAHLRGWNIGTQVYVFHDEKTGKDTVRIHKTKGSGSFGTEELIAEYTE